NDVLAIINYINAKGSGPIPAGAPIGPPYVDVDADDQVIAQDVLDVINWINAHPGQSEGEAASAPAPQPVNVAASSSLDNLVSLLAADISAAETKRRRV